MVTHIVAPQVRDALDAGRPVVALESTIISHGMPYPQNVQVAREVESILSSRGVTPATIAILKGKVHIGLGADDLEYLGKHGSTGKVRKVSRRDVAYVTSHGLDGATTVSTTMMFAHEHGIRVFVTGGIGGVHRGVSSTWDISADLHEFTKSTVCVVCAGAKSILDLPKTLEVLESYGVPVVGYKTDEFPNFFTPTSGLKVPIRVDEPRQVAHMLWAQETGGVGGGMVVCNPIRPEDAAHEVQDATTTALREADEKQIGGKDVTPFLLKRINELTKGKSLHANIALVKHNAEVGAEIAIAYASLPASGGPSIRGKDGNSGSTGSSTSSRANASTIQASRGKIKILCVGGVGKDTIAKPDAPGPLGTSLIGKVRVSNGGVGRNIAEVLGRLGVPTALWSACGDDSAGRELEENLRSLNVVPLFTRVDCATANFMAILDGNGGLVTAVGDMEALDKIPPPPDLQEYPRDLTIVDGNMSPDVLKSLEGRIWFEPVSTCKAKKLQHVVKCDLTSPNWQEALTILDEEERPVTLDDAREVSSKITSKYSNKVVLTMGKNGALVSQKNELSDPEFLPTGIILNRLSPTCVHLKPMREIKVVNDTGAGDTLLGVTAWATIEGHDLVSAVALGMIGAEYTLQSHNAVSPDIGQVKRQVRGFREKAKL